MTHLDQFTRVLAICEQFAAQLEQASALVLRLAQANVEQDERITTLEGQVHQLNDLLQREPIVSVCPEPTKGSYAAVFGHLDMTPDEIGNRYYEMGRALASCVEVMAMQEKLGEMGLGPALSPVMMRALDRAKEALAS